MKLEMFEIERIKKKLEIEKFEKKEKKGIGVMLKKINKEGGKIRKWVILIEEDFRKKEVEKEEERENLWSIVKKG